MSDDEQLEDNKKTLKRPAVDNRDESVKETGHLSYDGEARGYIEEFLDHEYLDDLMAVIQGTEKLTNKTWRVVVTSKGTEIKVVEGAAIMGKDKDEDENEDEDE